MTNQKRPKTKGKRKRPTYHQQATQILYKIYRLFEERPDMFIFKRMPKYRGLWEPGSDAEHDRILIDHRDEILATLIHECLHHFYPEWPEKVVYGMEQRVIQHISARQATNLLRRFGNII